ncbi:teichoic acids export ABC transporter ATP-binding subunit TagH [Bacillus cytotoxicus]|uniref:teichoic acids export ABC transporter ATP-binding subunit TagH n=1 Tax=Bacillus cytotoxicus TaxID=580165 RepID=UPI001AEECA99|nr:teichoic acids export ABC transporter ATP-binding subunit TagH [Bacillus cytotoxicus]QTR71002.1 teichoic acids export ABC transporter ATP-binding subunit TagH [Bacillus cytotoxicus]HDR7312094.1 teichoic acids export ABC transporter ATP-binding subunit TagH [Bacillus cytotoxicus]
MNNPVKFHNVTKKYKMHSKNTDKLKDMLYPGGFGEDFYALQNITFEANRGDVIGIIGINGSGKSTLSNLIAGITLPTKGKITKNGHVSLIAIAAGLNNQLTGRENIELKCLMLGFTKEEIEKITPDIIDFADIGAFIDMPVKKYSSGMKSRLGFAISVSINPDILVIDEALSVGDQTFADKCLQRMNKFKEQGKTIFFVSHSMRQVKRFCTKALWLEYGEIRGFGPIEQIMPQYELFLTEYKKMSKEEQKQFKEQARRKQAGKIVVEEERQSKNAIKIEPVTSKQELKEIQYSVPSELFIPRKKARALRFKWIWFAMVTVILIAAGGITYEKRNQWFTFSEKQEDVQVEKKPKIKKEQPLQKIDIRYIFTAKARVRSGPSINSSNIGLLEFGQPLIVKEVKQDENGEGNWLKFERSDGTEGWVGEPVTKAVPYENLLVYDDMRSKLEQLINQPDTMQNVVAAFGKTKSQVNELQGPPIDETVDGLHKTVYYRNLVVGLSPAGKTASVIVPSLSIRVETLLQTLGTPQIQSSDQSTYIYRTNEYDFIFTTSNGILISQMKVISVKEMAGK